jgi:hypothetical protein
MSPRCYTVPQILDLLQMAPSTFTTLKQQGKLPFLEELQPRLGKRARYRADLVDRYLAGEWGQSRFFSSHKKAR